MKSKITPSTKLLNNTSPQKNSIKIETNKSISLEKIKPKVPSTTKSSKSKATEKSKAILEKQSITETKTEKNPVKKSLLFNSPTKPTTSKHFENSITSQSPEKIKSPIKMISPRKTRSKQNQVTAGIPATKTTEQSSGIAKSNIKKRIKLDHDYPSKTTKSNTQSSSIPSQSKTISETNSQIKSLLIKKSATQPLKSSSASKIISPKEITPQPSTSSSSSATKSLPSSLNRKRKKHLESDDDDFRPISSMKSSKIKSEKPSQLNRVKKIDRRILSTDDDLDLKLTKKIKGCDYWVELYSEKSKRWYCVDLFKPEVDCAEDIAVSVEFNVKFNRIFSIIYLP